MRFGFLLFQKNLCFMNFLLDFVNVFLFGHELLFEFVDGVFESEDFKLLFMQSFFIREKLFVGLLNTLF